MRPVLRALALLAFALPSAAQDRIPLRGIVTDAKSGAPIDNAEVILGGAAHPVRTDADGSFHFDSTSLAGRTLRVRRIGYASRSLLLDAATGARALSITLAPAARELDALVVTAARREQKLKDVVTSTELVSRDDIESTGASNIAAVLTTETGVQFSAGHPSGSAVSLEGLSDQRVLILVDGLPLYGNIAGGLDLTRIPTSVVERVEIVKGPQSTLYGSQAMGGVVNIITRSAGDGVSGLAISQTGGSDRRSDTDISGSLRRGALSATSSIGHQYAERTPGIAATAGALTDRLNGMTDLRWRATDALSLSANALVLNERQRWPSGVLYQYADNTQLDARLGAQAGHGATLLTATAYFSELQHLSRSSQFTQPIAGTGVKQTQRLEQADVLFSRHASHVFLDAGASMKHEFIATSDGRVAGGRRTLNSAEPYAQLELSNDRWSVVPGLRASWNEVWGTYVTPRLAARFRADSSLTVRAAFGRGYRAPDFKELYLDFTNTAAFYSVHGNAALQPESSTNASVGAEWDGARFYGRGMLFANQLRDFIETVPLASSGSFAQYSYQNIARGTTRGAEITAGTARGLLRMETGYAYLYTLDNSTGAPLLGQPAHSGKLTVNAPAPFRSQITASEIVTGRTPMQVSAAGLVTDYRDAYARLDMRIAHSFSDRYMVSAGVDNALDVQPARWADATRRQLYVTVRWQLMPGL